MLFHIAFHYQESRLTLLIHLRHCLSRDVLLMDDDLQEWASMACYSMASDSQAVVIMGISTR